MNANQMPPDRFPARRKATPPATSSHPTASPASEAIRVAWRKLPVALHTSERSSRPPSSGSPGIRLTRPAAG